MRFLSSARLPMFSKIARQKASGPILRRFNLVSKLTIRVDVSSFDLNVGL